MNSFSYSMIKAALKCNQYYKLVYIDKLKSDEPESGDLHFGTAMHGAIEELIQVGTYTSFNAYWDSLDAPTIAWGRFGYGELREQAQTLLERFQRLHMRKYKPREQEIRIKYQYLPLLGFEGTPDFVGDVDGVPSVVDFKTAGYRYDKDLIKVSDQLYLYAYLALSKGLPVHQLVYTVLIKGKEPSIQTIIEPLNEGKMLAIVENLATIAEEVAMKETFTRNHNQCIVGQYKCNMFKICHKEK